MKNNKSKSNSMLDLDDRVECHDRQVLSMGNSTAFCEGWLLLFQVHKDQSNNASERHQWKNGVEKTTILSSLKSNPMQRK